MRIIDEMSPVDQITDVKKVRYSGEYVLTNFVF